LENKFKNLIQNAEDIIFETDVNGNFLFVNEFTIQYLGYSEKEILGKPFTDFVGAGYKEQLLDFYQNLMQLKSDFPTIEFPVIRKDKSTVWGSQKVIVNRDLKGEIAGYFGIMRDITSLKNLELKEKFRLEKIELFNKTINNLSASDFSNATNFDEILTHILKSTAVTTKTDFLSYWYCQKEQLVKRTSYDLRSDTITFKKQNRDENTVLDFVLLKERKLIIIPNLKKNPTGFFIDNTQIDSKYNSMLVMSVFHNSALAGVLCFANEEKNRVWDSEDVNFIRTITNIISLGLELQLRLISEKQLKYKSQFWSVVSNCTELFLQSKSPFELFSETFDAIGAVTDIEHMYYYENNLQTNLINQKYKWGKEHLQLQITPLQTFTHTNFQEIVSACLLKKPFLALTSQLEDSFLKTILRANEIKSILIVPLFMYNQFSGFIGFDSCSEERKWTEDEVNILQVLANNISSVIERSTNERLVNESEERFRLLANNIPGTVYLSKFDAKWTKIYLNDQIEKLTGYQKSDFIANRVNFSSLIHEDDKDRIINLSAACIKKGDKIRLTYRIRTKENKIKWIEEFADIIKKNDVVEYIEGIFIDITERKQTESAIIDKELAQSANKAKSKFLANMSHEIKTPLNGIIGFTDLLMKSPLNEEQECYMTTVNHSASTLLGIINDILDFSKIEAGKLELDLQPAALKDLLNSIRQVVLFDLEQKNLELNIFIDSAIPETLLMDSFRVKQIFLNLVSNAIKFTREGQVAIQLNYKKKISPLSHKIRFLVVDTGIGIALQNQKKIFKPFLQEDNSTTRKYGGTGLGLTITNQLLKLMSSKLKVKSSPLQGSTFYFDLTLKESKKLVSEEYLTNETNTSFDTKQLNIKILIAEDNAINMLLIKTILMRLFPKASLAESTNGEEAVAKYITFKPDLILMDVQMPLLNGIEATQKIRALHTDFRIPIIALTAGTLKEERELCLHSGMDDFVSKPIVKETIRAVILKWIATRPN
jgi:PAS domain S-box-containing protein